ncbi:MAG: hypothetical protein C0595_10055 [Marinilabiliales bacterium]|nr:MAG: hypothetical protein C0595_10055 [Marinilabiliales bacterium]
MANLATKILKNNNFLSLANNGLVAVLAFFSFMILVRSLPTDDFGKWVLFLTTANFLDMLRFGITSTAMVRFLSGANKEKGKELIGSNYLINFVSSIILISITLIVSFYFKETVSDSGFSLFFEWFPLFAIVNLPFNNALSVLQARLRFDLILLIRIINVGIFMLFLLVNYFFLKLGLLEITWVFIATALFTSIVTMIFNWDGIRYIFHAKNSANKIILNFGKYTTGTLIGSNLLKSADTFIIGLSPFLGTTAVALYSIPLKLTEIIEIPVRSYAMTAFPGMSKASIEGKKEEVKRLYYQNAGGLLYMLIPVMIFCFIFAEEFVTILGGAEYTQTAGIFRIFCFYGLLLPIDRLTGVALDSVNLPKQNFIKVIYMTSANIIGDGIMVFGIYYLVLLISGITLLFSGIDNIDTLIALIANYTNITILELVAVVTLLFSIIGILVGFNYLNKELDLKFRNIFTGGISFFSVFINKVLARKNI